MEKFDVSIILPIKTSKATDFSNYFEKAINSLKEQKIQVNEIVIVYCNDSELVTILNDYDFGGLNVKKLLSCAGLSTKLIAPTPASSSASLSINNSIIFIFIIYIF